MDITKGAEAIVFIVSASGAIGERFGPGVEKKVSEGVPVFLVSSNSGDQHGILRADTYGASEPVLNAGATPIGKYNVEDIELLIEIISRYLDQGLKGKELAEAVKNETSYKEGEAKPKAGWETPEDLARQAEMTKQTLRRMGLSEDEIDADMARRWDPNNEWIEGKLR